MEMRVGRNFWSKVLGAKASGGVGKVVATMAEEAAEAAPDAEARVKAVLKVLDEAEEWANGLRYSMRADGRLE